MTDPAFWYAKARMELRLARTAALELERLEAASSRPADRGHNRSAHWHRASLAALESLTIWLCQAAESREHARHVRRTGRCG